MQESADEQLFSTARFTLHPHPPPPPQVSPFEAAAFLESLHEGRALLKGDWNLCWARLAVSWQVQEAVLEYAAQVRRPNTPPCVAFT